MPRPKKKRKPKSQRGKRKKTIKDDSASALTEAMDILGFAESEQTPPQQDAESDERKSESTDE